METIAQEPKTAKFFFKIDTNARLPLIISFSMYVGFDQLAVFWVFGCEITNIKWVRTAKADLFL